MSTPAAARPARRNRYLRKRDVARLFDAIRAARLQGCPVKPEVQVAMRGYLNGWVVAPIVQVLIERGFIDETELD
jgi:hypothetical protein